MAVCDLGGSGSTARVCGQWRYDAYGAATAAEHLHAFPTVRCGHKALFFDRLDSASADSLGNEPPRLIPFAHLVVQMRNRAYMPQLGRFLQPDPNATALTLIAATSYHGRGMGALVAAFDVQSLYGDGMNLYEYLGSSPWGRRDPLGLFLFDAIMAYGEIGYRLGRSAAAMVGNYAFDLEMDADWATDWSASDWEYSRHGLWSGGGGDSTVASNSFGPIASGSIIVRGASAVGRAAMRRGTHIGRLVEDLHHIIPEFLGGLTRARGSRYGLDETTHTLFHRGLAQVVYNNTRLHPTGRGGGSAIQQAIRGMSLPELIKFRREMYQYMAEFDVQHGTKLVAAFRREFSRQRSILGHTGIFR